MSKGTWGQFADDADSIFIDEPMPKIGVGLVAMFASAAGGYFGARHFGANVVLALVAGAAGYAICTALTFVGGRVA